MKYFVVLAGIMCVLGGFTSQKKNEFGKQDSVLIQPVELNPPYLENAGMRNGMSVWIVDGVYIRSHIDIEFTNYGQHYNFRYIPKN
ncbi:MAG: hypothetical protein ABI623_03865, partial [bacterium]